MVCKKILYFKKMKISPSSIMH